MRILLRATVAAAVAAAGLSAGWQAPVHASNGPDVSASSLVAFDSGLFLVEFHEHGMVEQARTLQARDANSRARLDLSTPEVADYKAQLMSIQAGHVDAISAAFGRDVQPRHYYLASHSGISLEINSQAELDALRALPVVKSVERDQEYELHTHRSAEFVGATQIWDGSAAPGDLPGRGEGAVVAILDTGITPTHPSFQNDASCGHTTANPKLLSYRDCQGGTTTGGVCSGTNPNDQDGHGTHVAGIAAGSAIGPGASPAPNPPVGNTISGIAQCAHIRAYRVCESNTCSGAATQAGLNNALTEGDVTASNYSIGGGTSPWSNGDSDRVKLDMVDAGIFTAASAGNTREATPNPIGQVNHRGPWVMTVASSTHDQQEGTMGMLSATGPGTPPAAAQGVMANTGSTSPAYTGPASLPIRHMTGQEGAEGCVAFPANYFAGAAALVQRGSCPFTDKVTNAAAAGATLVLIYNNDVGALNMDTTGAPAVPHYSIIQMAGDALAAFIADNGGEAQISFVDDDIPGDMLSGFSFRGPTPGNLANLTKPDITAPGDDVYSAAPSGYVGMGGTSMSGPQVAGGGALVGSVQPDWTATEIKSAIMMTAEKAGTKDGVWGSGPWDADDVGSGRMDLSKAALAGLVMHETRANFLAANPSSGGDVRTLNLPALRDMSCTPSCTWTRTVRNTVDEPTSWSTSGHTFNGVQVTVSPASFNFTGDLDETQVLTITATPLGTQTAAVAFGEVQLVEAGGLSPDLHLTVAVRGQGLGGPPLVSVDPTSVAGNADSGSTTPVSRPLTISNMGGSDLTWNQASRIASRGTATVIWDQPVSGSNGIVSSYSTDDNGGAYTAGDFVIGVASDLTEIVAWGFNPTNATPPQVNWAIYADAGGVPAGDPENNPGGALWTYTAAASAPGVSVITGGEIRLDLAAAGQSLNLAPGTYWLTVYPTYNNAIGPAGSSRWNWFESVPQGGPSLLVGGLFGVGTWTPTGNGGLGTAIEDIAFQISGVQAELDCGAPWLSINPTSGTVAPGGNQGVSVIMDPSGLADGQYTAAVCLETNDPSNPELSIPATLNVGEGGGPVDGDADLSLMAFAMPDPVGQGEELRFIVNVANFGPDTAEDVAVEFALPAELQFVGAVTSQRSLERATHESAATRGTGNWNCADNGATVDCALTGSVDSGFFAPTLELILDVPAGAEPGVVSTDVTVSSAQNDPNPGNNSVSVEVEITGLSDGIFASGFECAAGLPDCPIVDPNIVDSGPVNLVINIDKQLNLVTGQFGEYGSFGGADINLYDWFGGTDPNPDLYVWWLNDETVGQGGVVDANGEFAVLGSGDTIGPGSTISDDNLALTHWQGGVSGYLGVYFFDESAGDYRYGYIEMETSPGGGLPLTITRYVYNSAGDAITIP